MGLTAGHSDKTSYNEHLLYIRHYGNCVLKRFEDIKI